MADALIRDILRQAQLFCGLAEETLALVAHRAHKIDLATGGWLFREGDPGEFLFVVEQGRLAAMRRIPSGPDVPLRELGPGEVGGVTSLATGGSRSASLRALEPTTVVTVARAELLELTSTRPDLTGSLLAFLGAKVRGKTGQLANLLAGFEADDRPRLAFFDTKPYERASFEPVIDRQLAVTWYETRLNPGTAALAAGHRVVCAFVNDELGSDVLRQLAAGGTELVALRCAGYNNVDLETALRLGLSITRVPAYSPHAVAEHAVTLILALNRKVHRAYSRVREGNFALSGLVGFDLHGRTAGIVGLGTIGRALVPILRGFGMRVFAYDAYPDPAYAAAAGVELVSLDRLLEAADIISLHAPLTPQTHHLINRQRIGQMKRGVVLINTSRGGLVSTSALIEGLKSGRIGAAGLDVYEEESEYFFEDRSDRVITDDLLARLMTFSNVLITSHQGFLTEDALANIAETTVANIREFLDGQRGADLTHAVLPRPASL
jgi:D-lactate dehydrogenase